MSANEIIRKAVSQMKQGKPKPVWFECVTQLHPPLTFKPPQKLIDKMEKERRKKLYLQHPNYKAKFNSLQKPVYKPPEIKYEEDNWRKKFNQQFPSEVMKPTTLDEEGPNDYKIDGERVIKIQLELMEKGINAKEAYQKACEEFRRLRIHEETEKKIALEQSLALNLKKTRPISKIIEQELVRERNLMIAKNSEYIKNL